MTGRRQSSQAYCPLQAVEVYLIPPVRHRLIPRLAVSKLAWAGCDYLSAPRRISAEYYSRLECIVSARRDDNSRCREHLRRIE
jgi:hypothetical protein